MDASHEDELARLRRGIGALDADLIRVLANRFALVDRLAEIKREQGIPIEDAARERTLCRLYESICAREGFDPESAKRIFHAIFAESKERQRAARRASGQEKEGR